MRNAAEWNQLSYICTFYTWSYCSSSALLAMSESTSILFSRHLSKYNVTEHWIITTQTDRTKKHEWRVKVCAHVSRGGGWGVVLKMHVMRLCIYYIRQKQKCEYRVMVIEKWGREGRLLLLLFYLYIQVLCIKCTNSRKMTVYGKRYVRVGGVSRWGRVTLNIQYFSKA